MKWLVETIAQKKSWRMDPRKWAMDCLPPEWHWKYFGIKAYLSTPAYKYKVGENIPIILTLENISDSTIIIGGGLEGYWGCHHKIDNGRCMGDSTSWFLPWTNQLHGDFLVIPADSSLKLNLDNFTKKTNFIKGNHSVYFIYTTWQDCGDCNKDGEWIDIPTKPIELEIY